MTTSIVVHLVSITHPSRTTRCCLRLGHTTQTSPAAKAGPGTPTNVVRPPWDAPHQRPGHSTHTVPVKFPHVCVGLMLPTLKGEACEPRLLLGRGRDVQVVQLSHDPPMGAHLLADIEMVRAVTTVHAVPTATANQQAATVIALAMHQGISGTPLVLAVLGNDSVVALCAPNVDSTARWVDSVRAGGLKCATRSGHQPPACKDATLGDLQGMGWPQVYAATGHSVHVMLGSALVKTHSRTSPGGSTPTGMWGAACTATSPPLPIAVLSFLNGTRVMAVQGACG